ncbi:MAG: 30S ribosomal protein S7, partial [Planctomycetota bacterium]
MKSWTKSEETLKPDPRYQSRLVSKFINCVMKRGKKATAQKIFYGSMDIIEQKVQGMPPLTVFETALQNLRPVLEVRSKRVGGATYQVPIEV